MRLHLTRILLVCVVFAGKAAYSYELRTHAPLTFAAFYQSTIANTQDSPLNDLGIDIKEPALFGSVYYDFSLGETLFARERNIDPFEKEIINDTSDKLNVLSPSVGSVPFLLMTGAIREDDIPIGGDNPLTDPNGDFFRVFGHFYDPIHDTGLRSLPVRFWIPSISLGPRNPDWALGTEDFLVNQNMPPSGSETRRPSPNVAANHFSLMHAREAMYRALTGRTGQGLPLPSPPLRTLNAEKDKRDAWWATTFRSLGDAMHLLEDMAQPQHSRNEAHSGVGCNEQSDGPYDCSAGHKSVYEGWIDARARGESAYTLPSGAAVVTTSTGGGSRETGGNSQNNAVPIPLPSLTYGGYPVPSLSSYRDFFTSKHLSGRDSGFEALGRTGLADYSNRGFFTVAKNHGSRLNDQPMPNGTTLTGMQVATQDWNGNPLPNGESVQLLTGRVPDTLNFAQSADGVPLTTYGIFDESLVRITNGGFRQYSLNRYNYDAMANLLLPRASAYAAGLLNYFFRGKIDFVRDPANPGKWAIKNLGPEDMKGNFTLYYDDANDKRYPIAGDTPLITWKDRTIPAGGVLGGLTFALPTNPEPKDSFNVVLVFNGDMGTEKAVPGSTVGAVAAKVLNLYQGALFLAGIDANGNSVRLRVDRKGTHVIKAGEFDPLASSITLIYGGKAYPTKQVAFANTPMGGLTYQLLSVSVGNPLNGGGVQSYISDTTSNNGMASRSGVTWLASAVDPAIGSFEFTYVPFYAGGPSIKYVRRYTDQNNAQQTQNGVLALPAPPGSLDYDGEILGGMSYISEDGLRITGLRGTATDGRPVFMELGMSLAAVPSITVSEVGTIEARTQTESRIPTTMFTDGSYYSLPPPNCQGQTIPVTGDILRTTGSYNRMARFEGARYIGYINANLARFSFVETENEIASIDYRQTLPWGEGAGGCPEQPWWYILDEGTTVGLVQYKQVFSFPQGALNTNYVQSRTISMGNYLPVNGSWSYIFEGFGPVPPIVRTETPVDTPRDIVGVVRALSDKAQDAIVTRISGEAINVKFRGSDLQDLQSFIADVSPLGEIFVATKDLRVLVHEPKAGGMKQVVIPPNVVKLTAVLWL